MVSADGPEEEMTARASGTAYDKYYSGGLSGPQQDPSKLPYNPRVPSFFITRGGDTLFLHRDPGGELPPDSGTA